MSTIPTASLRLRTLRLVIWASAVLASVCGAHAAGFVGSEKCTPCHEPEAAKWRAGPHATVRRLTSPSGGRTACVRCHTTGGLAPFEPRVGCESCHGAGEHYAQDDVMRNPVLAGALGLRNLDGKARIELCRECHRDGLRLTPLDLDKALEKMGHP